MPELQVPLNQPIVLVNELGPDTVGSSPGRNPLVSMLVMKSGFLPSGG